MDQAKRRKIASSGGIAVHKQGRAHTWTSDEAGVAKKGGRNSNK